MRIPLGRPAAVAVLCVAVVALGAQEPDIMVDQCAVIDKARNGVVESTRIGCTTPERESTFILEAYYDSAEVYLMVFDRGRELYVPESLTKIEITFGASHGSSITVTAIWNAECECALTPLITTDSWKRDVTDHIFDAFQDGAVLSYQIGELADVHRIPLPQGVRDLYYDFWKRIETHRQSAGS